jgi:hypothetical protein
MMGAKKSATKMEKLKIPLSFKQTVMAALETPPERRKPLKKKQEKAHRVGELLN